MEVSLVRLAAPMMLAAWQHFPPEFLGGNLFVFHIYIKAVFVEGHQGL